MNNRSLLNAAITLIALASGGLVKASTLLEHQRQQFNEEGCTLVVKEELETHEDGHHHVVFDCGFSDGTVLPLVLTNDQRAEIAAAVKSGRAIPGVSKLHVATVVINEHGIKLRSDNEIHFDTDNGGSATRKLSSQTGSSNYLIVKVTDSEGQAISDNTSTISDNFFGTGADLINLKSQMHACSNGALEIIAGYKDTATQIQKDAIDNQTIAQGHPVGIMEITLHHSLSDTSKTDEYHLNAAIAKVNAALGLTLPGPFDNVAFLLKKCYNSCNYGAYAYINDWRQVYLADNYKYATVQMHEHGHNMGLRHSGEGAQEYGDYTCSMGNPLLGDDLGKMCYNPAKSFELGWYENGYLSFEPTTSNPSLAATLMGVGEWSVAPLYPVVVKVPTPSGYSEDFFIGFNRATGATAQNVEASDQVTVIAAANGGASWLRHKIGAHESATITNWKDTGSDLIVSVESINLDVVPGTATVTITESIYPTPAPATECASGQDMVVVNITTDAYPGETSWSIENAAGSVVLVESPAYPQANTLTSVQTCISDACGSTFIIVDSATDGGPSFSISVNGDTILDVPNPSNDWGTLSYSVMGGAVCPPVPTAAPTELVCPLGEDKVEIELFTDAFPEETSWEVQNAEGVTILEAEVTAYSNLDDTLQSFVGCAVGACGGDFTVRDSYGDGFCCSEGSGYYSVSVNNRVVVPQTSADFGLTSTHEIVCNQNQQPGNNGDPIILGLQNQVFKFEGRANAWYSNLASRSLQWNMQFKRFNSCPADENMFVSSISLSTLGENDNSRILITTTPEPIAECREDPNKVCLGEGTLHISFDGGNTFISEPGDYHSGLLQRVVAHNTYGACSRKWHDYDISPNEARRFRNAGRRLLTVEEKKPLQLLSDNRLNMIDQEDCENWIQDRSSKQDLFQQGGKWSTIYVETALVSFHLEYRRSDWFDRKCDFQSLDAWMTKVSESLDKEEWNGILGETKHMLYDKTTGEQIKGDRSSLLRGKLDADYEVDGPFETKFAAMRKTNAIMSKFKTVLAA